MIRIQPMRKIGYIVFAVFVIASILFFRAGVLYEPLYIGDEFGFFLFVISALFFLFWLVLCIPILKTLYLNYQIFNFKREHKTYSKLYYHRESLYEMTELAFFINGEKAVYNTDKSDLFIYIPQEIDEGSKYCTKPTTITLHYLHEAEEPYVLIEETKDIRYVFQHPNKEYDLHFRPFVFSWKFVERNL